MAIRSLFNLVPWATWAWTSHARHQKDGMCSRKARSLDIVLYPCSVLLISPTHLDKWSNNAMCVWAHASNCTDPRWLITILGNSMGSCFVYNDSWTAHTLGHHHSMCWSSSFKLHRMKVVDHCFWKQHRHGLQLQQYLDSPGSCLGRCVCT